jgi:acetyl esterase/lipase
MTGTNFDRRGYEPIDDADKVSCRPDFAVAVYPGGVVSRDGSTLSPAIRVSKDTPPTFLVHAGDDRVSAENSVLLYLALRKAGVPAELHVYAAGGHGYGLRPSKNPVSGWPQRCAEWLRDRKILSAEERR